MKYDEESAAKMDNAWETLYRRAMERISPRVVSKSMSCGEVSAAVLTGKGNVYLGVCIDTECSLGMCAERNALSSMLTYGESDVVKVVAVYKDGRVMPPCGACREFMAHMGKDPGDIEILLDNYGKSATLAELLPEYPI